MQPIRPIAQLEMLVELAAARVAAEVLSIQQLLDLIAELVPVIERFSSLDSREADEWVDIAKIMVGRASKLVPGTSCMHRALACRLWFARRGVNAQIVVGFRKRGALEGHAWLEVKAKDAPLVMFRSEGDGYRESFRERSIA